MPWQLELPPLGAGECRVRVLACGVCHSDIHCVDDDWKASRYPLVPGHEVVGEVTEVGANVTNVKVGERVGVSWQCASCGECRDCARGNENLCDDNQALILSNYGGFAETVQLDARWAFPLPDALETALAGPLLCAGVTVYASLIDAGMNSDGGEKQRIGVVGLGGLGHLAIQFASKLGHRVTAFTTSPDKAEFAREMGAHEVIIAPADGSFAAPPARDERLDILLITATADLDWAGALEWLDSDGALSVASVPESDLQIPVFALQNKRRRVTGSNVGSREIIAQTLRVAADCGVRPIVETFGFDEINAAFARVRAGDVRFRAVLVR